MSSRSRLDDPLRRLREVHARACASSDLRARDYTRLSTNTGRGGHGTHRTTSVDLVRRRDPSLHVELEDFLTRAARVFERRLVAESKGERRPAKAYTRELVLAERGVPVRDVAYMYDWTTDAVRRVRKRNGLDPDTGEPIEASVSDA